MAGNHRETLREFSAHISQRPAAGHIGSEAVVEYRGRRIFRGCAAIRDSEDPLYSIPDRGRFKSAAEGLACGLARVLQYSKMLNAAPIDHEDRRPVAFGYRRSSLVP